MFYCVIVESINVIGTGRVGGKVVRSLPLSFPFVFVGSAKFGSSLSNDVSVHTGRLTD